ncbi:UNVERIFIED_CONTAM: hypothetical protein GTU68_018162, partial [Idotea baltica]|nr:hypothetical protein [Idotea baltica]
PATQCINWINQYFADPFQLEGHPVPKLCPLDGETFRAKVWETLLTSVDVGETVTYKDLAVRLENPGAVRAVGSAMRNNPIGILVPCHRVVRQNGLGLYCGGSRQRVKEWLLTHEGVHVSELQKKHKKR